MGGGPAHGPGPPHRTALPEARARAGGARGGPEACSMTDRGFALRFISGKYQGGEYPLQESGELVIGRSSDLDMVLIEDMVSRKHAKLILQPGSISIAVHEGAVGRAQAGDGDAARLQDELRVLAAAPAVEKHTVRGAGGARHTTPRLTQG